jgi:hypothetical protein
VIDQARLHPDPAGPAGTLRRLWPGGSIQSTS